MPPDAPPNQRPQLRRLPRRNSGTPVPTDDFGRGTDHVAGPLRRLQRHLHRRLRVRANVGQRAPAASKQRELDSEATCPHNAPVLLLPN